MGAINKEDLKLFSIEIIDWFLTDFSGVTSEYAFKQFWTEKKAEIENALAENQKGYFSFKKFLAKKVEIPENILTVILKEMREEGTVIISPVWDEAKGHPAGSGYGLTKLNK